MKAEVVITVIVDTPGTPVVVVVVVVGRLVASSRQ